MKYKVLFGIGTRPEAIKIAPVIRAFKGNQRLETVVVNTGQHGRMLEMVLHDLEMKIDETRSLMSPGQNLAELTSKAINTSFSLIREIEPDLVFVHGDTTTAYSMAVGAFLNQTPIAHIEAGLRTHNLASPFPEEFNRQQIARVASLNFAPTEGAALNLISEGIEQEKISITGNTVVDSTLWFVEKYLKNPEWFQQKKKQIQAGIFEFFLEMPYALVTLHRRENQGENFRKILNTLKQISIELPNFTFIFPVHPNPGISDPAKEILSGQNNIRLIEPLDYLTFMTLLNYANFALTDSGGVQEEGATFETPVIIARESTERPEGVASGHLHLVGSNVRKMEKLMLKLSSKDIKIDTVINSHNNPYGSGNASELILEKTVNFLLNRGS